MHPPSEPSAKPREAVRILAVDVGTQSVRAIVFDLNGQIIAKSQIPIEPYVSPEPGWAEQDPLLYWHAMGEACQALWDSGEVQASEVDSLSLTTQRATMCFVDTDGAPLRPAIVWLDQRQADVTQPLGGPWSWLFRMMDWAGLNMTGTIDTFRAEADSRWVAQNQPEVWNRTHKYVLLSGFLSHRLVGRFVDSVGAQVGYIPFDYKNRRWAGRHSWHWQALPVQASQLPDLVAPGGLLGSLTEQAATHLGLNTGLPVIAAAADKACEVLGAGCTQAHEACLSFGTTATINTTQQKYREVTPFMPPYPAALPGHYNTEVQIYRGFWMVSWFKEQFAQPERERAAREGLSPEQILEEVIRDIPAGSMGLMLQPYWTPGVRDPGLDAKGAVIGFGDVHTRAHLYRAILEGLAYGLRQGKERTEKRCKTKITTVRIGGGGSQSDTAMQLTADIFGQPVERPHIFETSALGAAMNAAVGRGYFRDHFAAAKAMSHPGDVFTPIVKNTQLYDELYSRVYTRMYQRLAPLYKDIRQITGYPA